MKKGKKYGVTKVAPKPTLGENLVWTEEELTTIKRITSKITRLKNG